MSRLKLFVPGRPVPQGSKTAFVNKKTGRTVVVDKDMRLPEWRMKITATFSPRFKNSELNAANPYWRGTVQFVSPMSAWMSLIEL